MNSSKRSPDSADGLSGSRGSSHPYTRFIPREELSQFASWTPGSLDAPPQAPTRGTGAQATPAQPADKAPTADLIERLEEARKLGYQDGYRDGIAGLDAFKQSWGLQMSQQVETLCTQFEAALESIQQEMAQSLVKSALQLAAQVLKKNLKETPQDVVQIAEWAVQDLIQSAQHLTVRVHPEDMSWVQAGLQAAWPHRHFRVLPDASLDRGGCLVESDVGRVDASLNARWRAASTHLGVQQDWKEALDLDAQPVAGVSLAQDDTP